MKDKIRCSKKRKQTNGCFDCADNSCRLNYYYSGNQPIKNCVYDEEQLEHQTTTDISKS